MRKENVASGAAPPTMKARKYLEAKTFCLGFPQYKEEAFNKTLRIMEAVRNGSIPYRGRSLASRNQIVKDLIVMGLALSGDERAIERMETKGFILPEVKHGDPRTVA